MTIIGPAIKLNRAAPSVRNVQPAAEQEHQWVALATAEGERDERGRREDDPKRGEARVAEGRWLPFVR